MHYNFGYIISKNKNIYCVLDFNDKNTQVFDIYTNEKSLIKNEDLLHYTIVAKSFGNYLFGECLKSAIKVATYYDSYLYEDKERD